MGIHFPSWRIILCVLLVLVFAKGSSSRKTCDSPLKEAAGDLTANSKDSHLLIKNVIDHQMQHMDPSDHVFFTVDDLKAGRKIPIYFPYKNHSASPRLLSREEANSIPFSLTQLPYLLELFSISKDSPQAKAMEYTLRHCDVKTTERETKMCAASLESVLDFVCATFGLDTQFKALTTNYLTNPVTQLQNYTILEDPKEILPEKIVGCHAMPYPYVVYYCHRAEGRDRLFEMLLGGEDGERVQAPGICHMDTSKWDRDHVSFRVLKMEPGTSPVCHFFPANNLVWVPLSA
ncbi:BURP domain protein USPL1-like [Hevea brasiliensis]|uniref:BURP domain protein USPL1-like n=1 Tax=Hevea brasiliensis TaxID=3981 RepID=UPI0025F89D4C|nr:BURP domain protein USPL1-like [Hevea brasiliensis]